MTTRRAVWLITLGACALRVAVTLSDDGLLYPDEVFQSLEQAHRLVFGPGFIPWEFQVGARPWVLPGILAPAMAVGGALGARLFVAMLSGLTAWACARLVRSLGGSALAELMAASLWALLNVGVLFGSRALGESVSTLPLVLGLALALTPRTRPVVLGSVLVALAVMLRLQVGLMAVVLPLVWLARGQRRLALCSLLTLFAGAVLLAVFDWASWGAPLQSVREYVRFNLIEGRAAQFGVAPAGYYASRLLASTHALIVVVFALAVLGTPRAKSVAVMVALFVGLHLSIGHKELRFVLPALPLLGVLAALGVDRARQWQVSAGWGASLVLVVALLFQPSVTALTWRQLGITHRSPDSPAFDDGGPETRLLRLAGRLPEVCGVELLAREVDSSGGYSALHRDLPLYDATHPPAKPEWVNAVIGTSAEGTVLATDGAMSLVKVRAHCEPGAAFDSKWPEVSQGEALR